MSAEPPLDGEDLWQMKMLNGGYDFAQACKDLHDSNPFEPVALEEIMIYLATELWDRDFSQTEIRKAFQSASEQLVRYAAGEERRGMRG
jgi:hypothetical protein